MAMMAECPSCRLLQIAHATCKVCGAQMGRLVHTAGSQRSAPRQNVGAGGRGGRRGIGGSIEREASYGFMPTGEKPFCITLGMLFSFLAGAFCLLMTLLVFMGGSSMTFYINDREVTREYFTSHALPLIVLGGGILLAIGYGFWTERPWSRHLVMVFWFLTGLLMLAMTAHAPPIDKIFFFGEMVIIVGIAVWYFYFKSNVVDYYRGLS